jgi:hypothetical protein
MACRSPPCVPVALRAGLRRNVVGGRGSGVPPSGVDSKAGWRGCSRWSGHRAMVSETTAGYAKGHNARWPLTSHASMAVKWYRGGLAWCGRGSGRGGATEVTGGMGQGGWRRSPNGQGTDATERLPAAALFILIGTEPPPTGWPPSSRETTAASCTGRDLLRDGRPRQGWPLDRLPLRWRPASRRVGRQRLRHGSVWRVASAVGEGATAYLNDVAPAIR